MRQYNIYERMTGTFMGIASGESAYDAIVAFGNTYGMASVESINRFYAMIILFS